MCFSLILYSYCNRYATTFVDPGPRTYRLAKPLPLASFHKERVVYDIYLLVTASAHVISRLNEQDHATDQAVVHLRSQGLFPTPPRVGKRPWERGWLLWSVIKTCTLSI